MCHINVELKQKRQSLLFIWLECIVLILYCHRERYSGMKASFYLVYSINYGTYASYGARLSQRKTP